MPKKSSKKKTTRKTSKTDVDPTGRQQCKFPGCAEREWLPGMKLCLAHKAFSALTNFSESAQKRGDVVTSLLSGFGARVVEHAGPVIQQQVETELRAGAMRGAVQYAQWRQNQAQAQTQQPAVPRANPGSPFDVLGLDPQTATSAHVRAMQRKLAALYHADKKTAGVQKEQMVRINAAAAECLKLCKNKGR